MTDLHRGVISGAVRSAVFADAEAFLGAAGTTTANFTNMTNRLLAGNPGLADVFVLAPERRSSVRETSAWGRRTRPRPKTGTWPASLRGQGAPGVLTLRAGGDISLFNAVSDGFTVRALPPSPTALDIATRLLAGRSLAPIRPPAGQLPILVLPLYRRRRPGGRRLPAGASRRRPRGRRGIAAAGQERRNHGHLGESTRSPPTSSGPPRLAGAAACSRSSGPAAGTSTSTPGAACNCSTSSPPSTRRARGSPTRRWEALRRFSAHPVRGTIVLGAASRTTRPISAWRAGTSASARPRTSSGWFQLIPAASQQLALPPGLRESGYRAVRPIGIRHEHRFDRLVGGLQQLLRGRRSLGRRQRVPRRRPGRGQRGRVDPHQPGPAKARRAIRWPRTRPSWNWAAGTSK